MIELTTETGNGSGVVDWPARVVLQTPDRHDLAWLISERLPHAA